MSKAKKYSVCCLLAVLLLATAVFTIPFASDFAFAETVATAGSLNDSLVVKYDMGNIEGGKIKASKWDKTTKSYVPASEMDATINNSVNGAHTGTVTVSAGQEGVGGATFTGKAHGRASFHLPSDATGMTISYWVKNVRTYWSSTVEFWALSAKKGGRFGNGTLQGNLGRNSEADPWFGNCSAHGGNWATIADGGSWDAFIIEANSGDSGTPTSNAMKADTWYQVTMIVTDKKIQMFRDSKLQITFEGTAGARWKESEITTEGICKSIMDAARNQTEGMLGLRLCHDAADGNELDDFRIYNGAMTQDQVNALYGEYKGIASLGNKALKTDDEMFGDHEVAINDGGNHEINVKNLANGFPKLLIGGATAADVTDDGSGTYSYTGTGYSYRYTVAESVATVTYTAGGENYAFTVTGKELPAFLSDIKVSVDGEPAQSIPGFDELKYDYVLNYDTPIKSLAFEATGGDGATVELPSSVNYNGSNIIKAKKSGDPVEYTVTVSRQTANVAPKVKVKGANTPIAQTEEDQSIFLTELPASASDITVEAVYPEVSTVTSVTFNNNTATFTVSDNVDGTSTSYTLVFKDRTDALIAYWDCDDASGNTVKGKKWNSETDRLEYDSSLDMTVRSSGQDSQAATESVAVTNMTSVEGAFGNAVKLPSFGFTTGALPAVSTSGFTFSAWTRLRNSILYEPIFAVHNYKVIKTLLGQNKMGSDAGAVFEKSYMQKPNFTSDGKVTTGYDGVNVDDGVVAPNHSKDEFTNTEGFVFVTITVSYVDGVGAINYYANGELVMSYIDHTSDPVGGNTLAKNAIEALQTGARFGLHRHAYDTKEESVFDDVSIYAYEMNAADVAAMYSTYNEYLMLASEPIELETFDKYPENIVLDGATLTGDASGKTGVTNGGITYSYTPLVAGTAVSKANDERGISVVVQKGSELNKRTLTLRFVHKKCDLSGVVTFTAAGKTGQLRLESESAEQLEFYMPSGTNLETVTASYASDVFGDSSDVKFSFSYSGARAAGKGVMSICYRDYTGLMWSYNISFRKEDSTVAPTLERAEVIGAATTATLAAGDFADGGATVEVANVADFELKLLVTVTGGAEVPGATAKSANVYELTVTEDDLSEGKFTFDVRYKIATTNKTSYTVSVAKVKSDNAALSALTVTGKTLSFNSLVYEYPLEVQKGGGEALLDDVTATPADGNATVVKLYDANEKKIVIRVTAENGNINNYYIVLTEVASTAEDDNTLSSIAVGGVDIEGFDPTVTEYTVKYKGEIPAIEPAANASGASVASVKEGDDKVKITVTAKNGTTKVYTLTFVPASNNTAITKLTVNGNEVTVTDKKASFDAVAGTRLENIVVVATPQDAAAKAYSYVDDANSEIKVVVTAEDGTVDTYAVKVNVAKSVIAEGGSSEDNSVLEYTGGSGGMIAVIIIVCVVAVAGAAVGVFFFLRKRKAPVKVTAAPDNSVTADNYAEEVAPEAQAEATEVNADTDSEEK